MILHCEYRNKPRGFIVLIFSNLIVLSNASRRGVVNKPLTLRLLQSVRAETRSRGPVRI